MQGTPKRLAVYSVRRAEQRRSFLADVSAALGVPASRRRLSACSSDGSRRATESPHTSVLDSDIAALFTEDDDDDDALALLPPLPPAPLIDPDQQITSSDDAAAAPPQPPRQQLQHEATVPLPLPPPQQHVGARAWCEIDTRERHTGPCAVESGATPFASATDAAPAAALHASTAVLAVPPSPSPSPMPPLADAESALTVSQVAARSRFALAPAQLDRVHAALSQDEAQTGPDDVVAVVAGTALTRLELQCLRPANWLTDTVINAYMDLINARSDAAQQARAPQGQQGQQQLPRCCALSTFFYTKLARSSSGSSSEGDVDAARMAKWTRGVDVLAACDAVLVPVHMGNHWCLAVVHVRARALEYYDSLGQRGADCLALLRRWLAADVRARHGAAAAADVAAWAAVEHSDIPVQQNGTDCGVFACKYAECVAAGRPCDFTQYDMNALRARMTYELLTGALLPPPPPPPPQPSLSPSSSLSS